MGAALINRGLGPIAGATISTPDLDYSVAAYAQFLGYRGSIGTVDPDLAERLGAPGLTGARMATLLPESGEKTFLRLIEGPGVPDYRPLTTLGWNAIEIMVQDLDRLAAKLDASPFVIIGEPRVLDFDFTDQISAMQVVGPGGEVLYLTQVKSPVPGFDLPTAKSFVGRIFVLILGTSAIEPACQYFQSAFGIAPGPHFQARIEVLSKVFGIDPACRHTLTTLSLPDQGLIEVDAFPSLATPRQVDPLGLLPGIAMASFWDGDLAHGAARSAGQFGSLSLISAPIELLGPQSP